MNRTSNYVFTIVVPVFNEEGNILRLENELTHFLKIANVLSCVLFVNDGSKDKSGQLIREACKRNPDLFFIELTQNGGLSAGIDYTQSQYIGYIDADYKHARKILIFYWNILLIIN